MSSLADKFSSRLARLAAFGKRDEDPLTNLKAASRWLDKLPVGDAYKCQQAVFEEIKRFNENSTGFTKDRLAVLMLIDEKSRDLQDTLVRQYLRNPRMSRAVESRLWHAVYGLYWEIARGYHTFVLHFARGSGRSAHENQIPLITLRALRTFGQLLKWRAIRYLPAGEKLWLRLHNLYRTAESEGFQRKSMHAYPGDEATCSCESVYLHVLMLNLANSGTLYPKQIDLLDTWLGGWHGDLQLEPRHNSETHNFVVDLSADYGPRRVRKPDADKPLRFWSTAALLDRLTQIQAALREGSAPAQLGLTEIARTAEGHELLDHLRQQWSSLTSREQRRAPRVAAKRLVDVCHGLAAIVGQIRLADAPVAVSPYGTGLNYNEADDVQVYGFITDRTRERVSQMKAPARPLSPDVERWVMQDESEYGYGALVESRDKDWLRVGAIVGVKSHDAVEWRLGVIRRLARVDDDTSSVGIEILPARPALATLSETTSSGYTVDGHDNVSARSTHAGLWLAGCDRHADSLVIDPIHFMPGKVFQINGAAPHQFIALASPQERSEGWMRVAVEPVAG